MNGRVAEKVSNLAQGVRNQRGQSRARYTRLKRLALHISFQAGSDAVYSALRLIGFIVRRFEGVVAFVFSEEVADIAGGPPKLVL